MRTKLILLTVLFLVGLATWINLGVNATPTSIPTNSTHLVTGDKAIVLAGGVYSEAYAGGAQKQVLASGNPIHWYWDFNTAAIPDNATVSAVYVSLRTYSTVSSSPLVFKAMAASGGGQTLQNAYVDCGDGATYLNLGVSASTTYAGNLLTGAAATLQAQLAANWFSLGLTSTGSNIWLEGPLSGTYAPFLTITYTYTTSIGYTISAKWENGTTTIISATVTEPGSTSTISVTGTPTAYYFTTQPISISWDLGAGVSRSIFIVGPSATIVLTKPSLTNAVYSFTIQDYTATIGDANSYLEAWRTIGGTPVLVEREQIFNRASTTPLTLQLYAAYNLFIRLPNNSTENYGYFVPTTNSPPYLTITKLTFAQMYQPVSKWVTDSITRVNATHIQVHYNDTLLQTTSTVVTIKNNLGTTIYSTTVAGNAFTVNWYAAISSTDYVVSYNATNTYYHWITDVRSLPGTFIPSHTVDWTPIGLPSAWIAVFLVLGGFFVVSAANRDLGVISGAAIAACTDYLHLSAFGIGIIIIVGIVGVLIALRGVFKY